VERCGEDLVCGVVVVEGEVTALKFLCFLGSPEAEVDICLLVELENQ
jgi:hypothetical protein